MNKIENILITANEDSNNNATSQIGSFNITKSSSSLALFLDGVSNNVISGAALKSLPPERMITSSNSPSKITGCKIAPLPDNNEYLGCFSKFKISADPYFDPDSLISTFIISPLKRGFSLILLVSVTKVDTPSVPESSTVIGGALNVWKPSGAEAISTSLFRLA